MGGHSLDEIGIRTDLEPGDLGSVIRLHGALYWREYRYTLKFEAYVAKGFCEFAERYDPERDRVWVCECQGRMVGFLLLLCRGEAAQLRYFLIEPEYRGIGPGTKLLELFMVCARERGYRSVYLWTTDEQTEAIRLFESIGFVFTEEKDSSAFGKSLKERRYEKRLA